MKSVACLCLLVVVVALSARSADAIACAKSFCATVRCAKVDAATCDGVVRPNRSFCGCCEACIRVIKAGESCAILGLLGQPPKWECVEGTTCLAGVCTPVADIPTDQ